MALLEVDNLNVRFATPDGEVHAVKDLSFALEQGETLGIVGESGSGKSQTVMSIVGLLAANGRATGVARFAGRDLLALPPKELRTIRGRKIAMIFQDPMTSLNPYLTIEKQMVAAIRAHERVSFKAARARCLSMLNAVATSRTSPLGVCLTGHSMGGHGTWHLAANDPDQFLAIAASAGWASFDTYPSGPRPDSALSSFWRGADARAVVPHSMMFSAAA